MRRLMSMIENGRVDLSPLVTHRFALDDIEKAYDLFSDQRDGVLKVALFPDRAATTISTTSLAEAVAGQP